MKRVIYVDNAATTRLDLEAYEAMVPYMIENYGNPSQPYSFSRKPKLALDAARRDIAKCIGAKPEEIFFTSGGTESDNWVIKEFGASTDIRHIITSNVEHHAVLNACKSEKQKERCDWELLQVDENGLVNPERLGALLSRPKEFVASCETTLVSVMFANNEIGTMQPIKELCDIAHKHGALFHTDAVQAVGHVGINVKELEVDFLSASAHKFNGPRGIGFLYARNESIHAFIDGGAQEKGKRAGTENVAAAIGMAKALVNNCSDLDDYGSKMRKLEELFLSRLRDAGLDFTRNGINQIPGNVSVSFANAEGEMLLHRLDLKGICVSTGSACDGKNTQVSHVIKAIGVPEKYATGTIRVSFGRYNEFDDAIKVADEIISILK